MKNLSIELDELGVSREDLALLIARMVDGKNSHDLMEEGLDEPDATLARSVLSAVSKTVWP